MDIGGSRIDAVLEQAVADGAVPHAAAIVADRNGILYEGERGRRPSVGASRSTPARPSASCR